MASAGARRAEQRTALPVFLITGSLGAGKTTFIKALLSKDRNVKGAILVCPYGENNAVDGALLRLQRDLPPGPVYSLSGDESDDEDAFDSVIKNEIAPKREALDLLIVEASGMADPQGMISALGGMHGINLEGVVCVVDATTFIGGGAATCKEIVLRQIAVADVIVLSHTALLNGEPTVDEVTNAILAARTAHGVAAPAVLRNSQNVDLDLKALRRALAEGGVGVPLAATEAGAKRRRVCTEPSSTDEGNQDLGTEDYASTVFCRTGCFHRESFERWAASLPATVLRAKGLLWFSGLLHPVEWQLLSDRRSSFVEVLSESSGTSKATGGIEIALIGRYGDGWKPWDFESGLNACLLKP